MAAAALGSGEKGKGRRVGAVGVRRGRAGELCAEGALSHCRGLQQRRRVWQRRRAAAVVAASSHDRTSRRRGACLRPPRLQAASAARQSTEHRRPRPARAGSWAPAHRDACRAWATTRKPCGLSPPRRRAAACRTQATGWSRTNSAGCRKMKTQRIDSGARIRRARSTAQASSSGRATRPQAAPADYEWPIEAARLHEGTNPF